MLPSVLPSSAPYSLDTIFHPLYHAGMKRFAPYMCLTITLLYVLPVVANDGAGTTAFSFVKIIPGARQAAIGGAFSAVGGDVNALYWNPAGLARLETDQATVTYTGYFQDVQSGFVGYARPFDSRQVIGFGLQYMSYGAFQETTPDDPTGSQLGTFGANDLAVILSYSRTFGRYTAAGLNVKTLYERIQDFSAYAFAVDVGLQFRYPDYRLSGAVVLQHVGIAGSGFISGRRDPLPVSIRGGVSYIPEHLPILISVDIEKSRAQRVAGHLGGEFNIRDLVFLRGGYASSGSDLRLESSDIRLMGVSGGIGFQTGTYRLDYAYTPTLRLGDVHRVSLTYRFE